MKIIISGASGKMGQEIHTIIDADSNLEYLAGFGLKENPKFKVVSNPMALPEGADMAIDFSSPESLLVMIEWCAQHRVPLVSGTTGVSEAHHQQLHKLSQKVPVLWSPNTSMGVALLKRLLEQTKWPQGFDIQMTEYHHIHKKDKPSGTALLLDKALQTAGNKTQPILSIRGGGIFGIHKVDVMGPEEIISFEHTALSRGVFARGAIMAARWLHGKPAGLYSMDDVFSQP